MSKALCASYTYARTIVSKIRKTSTRGHLVALFILMAMAAMALVSTAPSSANSTHAKSARTSGSSSKDLEAKLFKPERKLFRPNVRAANEDQPTLTTEKENYLPGETIAFTGKNWTPGEAVTIVISTDTSSEGTTLQTTADDSGSFTITTIMPDGQVTGAAQASAVKSDPTASTSAATGGSGIYTATATGAISGATVQVQFTTELASVNVPTPGCRAVLTPDVIDHLRGKPTDPLDDFEAWRQEHPNMIEVSMPLQCQSEAWRVLHGLMAEPSTQAQEALAPLSPSAGTDIDMAGGVQAYQGEVNIAVDPNNPLHLVAGANSFYRDPSAACQSPTGGSANTYGTQALYGSTDGGATWTYKCAPWNPTVTGGITGAAAWFGSDPAMAWDGAGNAYAVYMLINQNSAGTSSATSIVIAKSTNNGTSWSNLGVIVNHETNASLFDDKEMVVVDTTVGQAHSHTGRIYVFWDENNVERVAYSDNGTSWTTVVMGSGTEIGGNVTIDPDGTVYAAWNHYSQTGGVGTGDSLFAKKSIDGGVTWTAPAVNPVVQHNLASFGSNNKPAAKDSHGIHAFPIIDVDRNPASASFGKVYIAYDNFPPAIGSGNNLNVYLINSANGGTTWSSQVLVNDDGGASTQFFPWMSVDQSDGTVNMSWIETRNFSANNRQTQAFTARSINGGISFEANVSVEDNGGNFRNNVNYSDDNTTDNSARNANQYGDYEGMWALNRIAHPIWTDTRNFYPSADTQSPTRAEDAVSCALTNCSAPTGVNAPSTAIACSPSRVQLSWSAPSGWGTNATSGTYSIYRSTTTTFPGGPPLISGLTTTSYDDTSGTPGVAYYYFVQAKNNCPGTALTPMSTTSVASASVVYPPCGPSGILQGTVTAGGSPVSGATVTAGAYSTTTDANGFYQFPAIATGTYTVTVTATGYNTASANNVVVTQNNTTVKNFTLTPTTTSACLTDTTQADFQAGVGTNVDLTTSPGDVKLALTGSEAVDQQQTNTGNTQAASVSTVFWTGNSFTPAVSGRMTRLDVNLFYSSGIAGDIIVQIRTVSGGLPTSTVLGQPATITGSTAINGFVTATFGSPATLTAGTQYCYILHTVSGVYGHRRRSNGAADYTGGTEIQSSSADAGYGTVASDCAFQTYMTPTTYQTSGNLVSSLKDSNPVVGATTNWTTISWTASTPANTTISFQVAASNNAAGPFNFVGPFSNGASLTQFNGNRYLKYKAFLNTTNTTVTPTLNDVMVCFTNTAANQAPVAKCKNVTVSADASCMANASIDDGSFDPDASDTITTTQSPAGPYSLGNTTVTLTVTDNHGASSSCTGVVTVVDTTPPTISCPAGTTASADANCQAVVPNVLAGVIASDNCTASGSLTKTQSPAAGTLVGLGVTTITVTVKDAANNTGTCTTTFTVNDTTAPSISCPTDKTVSCDASTDPSATGTATATDSCSTATVTHSDVTTPGSSAGNYTITRTWTATDASGNSSSCTQIITVQDTTAPAISCPANQTVSCDASTDPSATGTATATDNCSTATVTHSDVTTPGSSAGNYTITRTWTATDASGNSSSCTQIITVQDTTAPAISCPANQTVSCDASTDPSATRTATATDNCSTATVTHRDVTTPGSSAGNYTITRTWTATDSSGNCSSCKQIVTVQATPAPVITCPADVTVSCAASTDPSAIGLATATDNCSGATVTYADTVTTGSSVADHTITRHWVATDGCGN